MQLERSYFRRLKSSQLGICVICCHHDVLTDQLALLSKPVDPICVAKLGIILCWANALTFGLEMGLVVKGVKMLERLAVLVKIQQREI